uniref:ABC-2 type transporter transmembrane domain-containing protein n=1 Tax=Phaeomonas parva TaxID=124430 RepID=A0A7S1Y021_9STRA|mmetsp:Transcript_6264/g.17529  ORF Transcript_6264/g.17529 Transcript_6264/m.17529 type:complete len:357 (+) Transcript_6264:985-2055(+)
MFVVQTNTPKELRSKGFFDRQKSDSAATSKVQSVEEGGENLYSGKASMPAQIRWLLEREIRHVARDTGSLAARFGITIFLNLLFGLIFQGAGDEDDSVADNLNTHFGALTMVTISSMFGSAQPTAIEFPFQRPVFLREYSAGSYSSFAYFISKLAMELPLGLLQMLVSWVVVYWLIAFDGNFLYMLLASWMLSICSASVAVVLGCAVADVKTVSEFLAPIFVPQLLFAGYRCANPRVLPSLNARHPPCSSSSPENLHPSTHPPTLNALNPRFFIRTEQIPVWLRWAQYLCALKYTMNILVVIEFGDCEHEGCENLLESNDVDEDHVWIYVLVLLALFSFFRLFALWVLVGKAKTVY